MGAHTTVLHKYHTSSPPTPASEVQACTIEAANSEPLEIEMWQWDLFVTSSAFFESSRPAESTLLAIYQVGPGITYPMPCFSLFKSEDNKQHGSV
jgi:hypothetical protein